MRRLIFVTLLLVFGLSSCQSSSEKKIPRFDSKSLEEHHRTRNINVLILWDNRIMPIIEEDSVENSIKSFLNNILQNFEARILITGIDGNPPAFFLASNTKNLPTDYSSLFYQVNKLDLQKFARQYNPNISILKSANELIQAYSKKNFFIPGNDFMVFVLSSVDDENFRNDMQGQKIKDELSSDAEALMKLNHTQWIPGIGKVDDFSFKQLRFFVMAPRSTCHKVLLPAPRLFYATAVINSHYTDQPERWQGQPENADLCELNFAAFWNQSYQIIEKRYQLGIPEREFVPKIP